MTHSQLPVTYTTLTQSVLGLSLHNINTKPSHPEPREPCPTTTDLPPLATESLRLRLLTATSGPPTTTTQLRSICTEVSTYQHQDPFPINDILGYEDDIYLLVKLGEAAIIIFIIFAVVAVLYMIINCCISISARNK